MHGATGIRVLWQLEGPITRYVYDGQMLIAEKDSAGHLKVSYTNGKGEVISRTTWTTNGTTGVTSPESTIFFLYDGSGNVNVVLDEQGALLKRLDYDVFGAERDTGYDSGANNSNAESNRMTFSGTVGHVGEPDLGLTYMRARYYDPSLGRFVSEDPMGHGNAYIYCFNDPVDNTDSTGLFADGGAEASLGGDAEAAEASIQAGNGCTEMIRRAITEELKNSLEGLGASVEDAGLTAQKTGYGWNIRFGGQTRYMRLDWSHGLAHFNMRGSPAWANHTTDLANMVKWIIQSMGL